jgi:hypothetical protein
MQRKLLVLVLVMAFILAAGAALAADQPSATISIIDVAQAIGVGPIWGQGVYHIKNLADLAGTYKKADPAGFTFIKNKKDLVIQNEKGVVIDLKGAEHGLKLDLVKDGLKIKDIQQ